MPRYNSGDSIKSATFLSSSVFQVPANVSLVMVTLCGGGGGGASGKSTAGGGGGGAGGMIVNFPLPVVSGQQIAVLIGSGGGGGPSNVSGLDGKHGGHTSFGSYLFASGGFGGTVIANSNGGASTPISMLPTFSSYGVGGDPGTNGLNLPLFSASVWFDNTIYMYYALGGGGGGGSTGAWPSGRGGMVIINSVGGFYFTSSLNSINGKAGGTGGSGIFGGGGVGGNDTSLGFGGSITGSNATGFGAGGGGGSFQTSTNTSGPGGSGSMGFVTVTWES